MQDQLKLHTDQKPPKEEKPKSPVDEFELEGKSLYQLLRTLDELDSKEETTEEEHKAVLQAVENKADSYRYVKARFEAEINRLEELEEGFALKKKSVKKSFERFKKSAAWVLNQLPKDPSGKLPFIKGNLYKMRLTRSQTCTPLVDATGILNLDYEKYIKVSYSWKKQQIKNCFETDESLKEVARLDATESITFDVVRSI